MVAAFRDQRANVRLFAALELPEIGRKEDLEPALQAWLTEEDPCAKATMNLALTMFVSDLTVDATQHPGGQPNVALAQVCSASIPTLVSLTAQQVSEPGSRGPVLRITARNHTSKALAFVWAPSPAEIFSVTVLDPNGRLAKVAHGREWLYVSKGPGVESLLGESHTGFVPLPPQDDVVLSTWRIGEDFDMSNPGTYTVSFGGRISYLDTTVCSNATTVTVER
jgi:hypothetical protein